MNEIVYFNTKESNSFLLFGNTLSKYIKENKKANQELIILCIGTDRATGDCLGPLVGERLKSYQPQLCVYGTLKNPVHALNLSETLADIQKIYHNPFIIAVDASLGTRKHIGYVTISPQPMKPGKGVQKEIPAIGNLSITGIVNISGFPSSVLLQSTRLHTVMELSDYISHGICCGLSDKILTA